MDRNQFIQQAIDSGVRVPNLSPALQEAGFEPLSKSEQLIIEQGNFGKNAWQRGVQDIVNIGNGLKTTLGGVGEYFRGNSSNRDAVNQAVYNYVTTKTPGQYLYDLTNTYIEPMVAGKSVGEILQQSPIETLGDIKASVVANPGLATLYALPEVATAGKAIKNVGKKVAPSLVNKLPEIKGVTGKSREVNEILNVTKQASTGSLDNLRAAQTRVSRASNEQVAQAVKNLEEGLREGDEAVLKVTQDLKDLSNGISELYKQRGYSPALAREEAVSQYITRKTGNKIPTSKVAEALSSKEKIKDLGLTEAEFSKLRTEGERLFNEGAIVPIRHSTTAEAARGGFVEEGAKKLVEPKAKMYGTHSYEDVARGLRDDAYTNLINKFEFTERVGDSLDQIIKSGISRKVTPEAAIAADEVVISPRLLKEKFGTSLIGNESVVNNIKELTRGLNKEERLAYKDDLYVFKKSDIKALQSAFAPSKTVFNSGVLGNLGNLAKQTVLATPSYVMGNAIANELINPMVGVNVFDTFKALTGRKDIYPQSIKRSASYTGYLENKLPTYPDFKDVYSKLLGEFKTGLEKKDLGQIAEASAMAANYPLFRASQNLETAQRAANYLKQAENYAKKTGRTVESVLKEAKQNAGNNPLGRKLKANVEKYLGDYTGRNYYLPEQVRDFVSTLAPFTRPYVQGVRQMYNLYKDYPVQAQLMATAPSRLGNEISKKAQEEQGITPSRDGGGYPVLAPTGKLPGRVLYNPYHVFSAVSDLANNPTETLSGNWLPFAWANAIAGRTRYGQEAKLPNQITVNGKNIILDNNGNVMYDSQGNIREAKPTLADKAKLFLAQNLNAYTPVNSINQNIIRQMANFLDKPYYRPSDYSIFGQVGDFSIPLFMQGDLTRRPQSPEEIKLSNYGFRMEDTYPAKKQGIPMRTGAEARLKFRNIQKKNERR